MSKKSKTSKTPAKKAASKGSGKTRVRVKAAKAVRKAKGVGPRIADAANVGAQGTAAAAEAQASPNTTTTTVDAETTPVKPITVKKMLKMPKTPKGKKVSGLDAAALVLKDKAVAMNAKDIVAEIFARGLWTSNGKTPAATLSSAMLREIDNKPGASRFAKTGPGLFALAQA